MRVEVDCASLPRTLLMNPPVSHAEFEEFCRQSDNMRLEHTKEGMVLMNPPAGGYPIL
jgi:hypothetical protein